jgi:hypothetical protein
MSRSSFHHYLHCICTIVDDTIQQHHIAASTVHDLALSRELQQFVHASGDLLISTAQATAGVALGVGGKVVKTVSLPVTVPLYVTAAATDHIINLAGSVIGGLVHHTIGNGGHNPEEEATIDDEETRQQPGRHTPAQDFLHSIFNFVPFVVDTVVKTAMHSAKTPTLQDRTRSATDDINQARRTTSRPTRRKLSNARSTHEVKNDFLDRLRLDFFPMEEEEEDSSGDIMVDDAASARTESSSIRESTPKAGPSDVSKYLLRIDDVDVMAPPNPASVREHRLMFVDLGKDFEDESLTRESLRQLVSRGIDIASSNVAVKVDFRSHCATVKGEFPIEWKPQGQTKKEFKRLSQLPDSEIFDSLRRQVLIWSGSYGGRTYHGSDQTIFMARGVVKGSPRDFMNLLWDSSRTSEYNNYCLGRTDVRVIYDDILSGGSYGAKIIKSETSIPFTSLSVSLTALMHARAIGDDPNDGFIIVSRSLNTGRAGYHVTKKNVDLGGNKNEIIFGVNYMRPVPGQPNFTDLISVSQVNASMLPPFLAFRIGMMGVEDFFKNVR